MGMRELLSKPATLWSIATVIFTAVVLGVVVEIVKWEQLPQPLIIGILVMGFLLSAFLYWYGYKQYKKARRQNRQINKVKTTVWNMYKLAQDIAERAGRKGLTKQKLQEVKAKAQKELKVPSIRFQGALTDEEVGVLSKNLNEKMKHKIKNPVSVDKRTFQNLSRLADILDKSDIGLYSLLKEKNEYKPLKDKLGEERVIARIDSIKVKKILDVSNTLNSTLLSFMYFAPIYGLTLKETKIPLGLFKDSLDEMLLDYLTKLGE